MEKNCLYINGVKKNPETRGVKKERGQYTYLVISIYQCQRRGEESHPLG